MKPAKRFAGRAKTLILFSLLIAVSSSCRKELFVGQKEDLPTAQTGAVKVANISYSNFLQKVNLNSLGTLRTTFQQHQTGDKLMSLGAGGPSGGLLFLTDSIKQVTTAKGNSYVFRMPLATANTRIFQNLTISMLKDTTIAFITTYTPDNEWITNRRNNIHIAYRGEISYTPISLSATLGQQLPLLRSSLPLGNGKAMSAPNKTMESVTVCSTFIMYTAITYGCSQGNHMPNDPTCPWNNGGTVPEGEYAAGTMYVNTPVTVCSSIAIDNGGRPGGGNGGGTGGGGGETSPYPPEGYNPCEPGLPCTEIAGLSPAQTFANKIGLTDFNQIDFLGKPDNVELLGTFENYLTVYGISNENKDYLKWATGYLYVNRFSISFNQFLTEFFPSGPQLIADPNADNWADPDNEILFDPDQTFYQEYQDNQPWPTVNRVIDFEKFVPLRQVTGANGQLRDVNCLVLAREQLGKVGYACSGYLPGGQTFSIFTTQNGVNLVETKKAISYVISSLSQKIPVLIGVDNRPGAPSANLDNSTDHYVVIVGMGTDEKGKYFQFMDSATENRSTGASYNNRLYYDSVTGKITGKTSIVGYRSQPGMRDYTVTQVRKSIKK